MTCWTLSNSYCAGGGLGMVVVLSKLSESSKRQTSLLGLGSCLAISPIFLTSFKSAWISSSISYSSNYSSSYDYY
jgi:hypothetical protein